MSRRKPLLPVFDFISAPEPVSLLRGAAEVKCGKDTYSGSAEVQLRFLPRPHVVIHARLQDEVSETDRYLWASQEPEELSLSLNGCEIKGFCGKRNASADVLELDWISSTLPMTLDNMKAETSVAAILHVFNFPDFRSGRHKEFAPAGCALLVLESGEWRIALQSLPNNVTQQAWCRIKGEGGGFLTHVAKLERRDGRLFSGDEARKQSFLLRACSHLLICVYILIFVRRSGCCGWH